MSRRGYFPRAGIPELGVNDGDALKFLARLLGDDLVEEVCQFFCVNGPVLFLGMGARGKGQRPFPRPAM